MIHKIHIILHSWTNIFTLSGMGNASTQTSTAVLFIPSSSSVSLRAASTTELSSLSTFPPGKLKLRCLDLYNTLVIKIGINVSFFSKQSLSYLIPFQKNWPPIEIVTLFCFISNYSFSFKSYVVTVNFIHFIEKGPFLIRARNWFN